tara:strand:- start:1791 stop:2654 length:864 start_codon:yes stop_codon:yes gene_type:complete
MKPITTFRLRRDLKKIKIKDKIQLLYNLEFLTNEIFCSEIKVMKDKFFLKRKGLESICNISDFIITSDYRVEYNPNNQLQYWAYAIKEIVELKLKYVDKLNILEIYDIIFDEYDLSYSGIELNINNIKKLISNLYDIFDNNLSEKIINDIHSVFSKDLQYLFNDIKEREKQLKDLNCALKDSNKLTKFAIKELLEEFKEEYVEHFLGETDYEGNTYDEDIVRDHSEMETEIIEWAEELYEESWEEMICSKIDELKKYPKNLRILIKALNKEIEQVTKYASYFGYEDK